MNNTIELQLEQIVKQIIDDISKDNNSNFVNADIEYVLDDNRIIKNNSKLCALNCESLNGLEREYFLNLLKKKLNELEHHVSKKLLERLILYYYLKKVNGLHWNFVDYERPDFIISKGDVKIGIEIGEGISKGEAILNRVMTSNNIKEFSKYTDGKVMKIGKNVFKVIQSASIYDLLTPTIEIIKQKVIKYKEYKKFNINIILIKINNPLICLNYYNNFFKKFYKDLNTELSIVLLGFCLEHDLEILTLE